MKSARTLVTLALGTLATLAAVSTPALAQDAGSASRATTSRHCVVDTDNGTKSCFGTYREAVAFATEGRVTDAPNDTRAAAHDKKLQERLSGPRGEHGMKLAENSRSALAGAQRVLATVYQDSDFRGNSLSFTGSVGCVRYPEFATMGSDWNDQISSVASGQCSITLYQHANFLGASQTYSGGVPYIGDAMNDQASSVSFDR
ncbi:peptidase inhibitor family I36 protein [Streptomyces sp. SCA3-4]|uniref:peptidase inhibitor family I36 protein n=1 Tax=Streptomyces sichuanensis TaxID=2871810 RepID=UPI001CE39E57|nr:peptidase inhibitor family I36 protein [Streptomyces sichuanensis]MCA6091341.1 peptidase inhibitor family I36 protein [Streptomyces sichuanensis]